MIKLGDFGLAVQLEHSCSKRNNVCGTSMYMGPEVYGEGAELKSDVWALGMSVIEMAESKNPFARCTSAQVMNRVMNMPPPSLSSSEWSSDLVDFVKKCLVKDVNERCSVEALLKHPFVKDSIERIRDKGNSSLLFQLAERVGNATPSEATTVSMNVVGVTMLNKPMTQEDKVRAEHVLRIDDEDDLFIGEPDTDAIYMKNGLCNDSDIVEWKLDVYPELRELVVGDDCLQCVKGFELSEFKCLEKVEIGARCFTSFGGGEMEVIGCGALRRFVIGKESCVKWSSFVMKNCDSIQEVSIGDGCFVSCENTVFENLSALTKLTVGKESFRGDEKKSVLVMKSECFERE